MPKLYVLVGKPSTLRWWFHSFFILSPQKFERQLFIDFFLKTCQYPPEKLTYPLPLRYFWRWFFLLPMRDTLVLRRVFFFAWWVSQNHHPASMFYFRKLLKQHQDISHQESLRSTKASTNSGVVQIPRGVELLENGGKNLAECNFSYNWSLEFMVPNFLEQNIE